MRVKAASIDEAAKIIDRLLCLLRDWNLSAADNALAWLLRHDHAELWLSVTTRTKMEDLIEATKEGK